MHSREEEISLTDLGRLVHMIAERYPQQVAFQIWQGGQFRQLTFLDLLSQAQKGAQNLQKEGLKSGDRVAILAETRRLDWVIGFFAIQLLGGTAIILDPMYPAEDLLKFLHIADMRGIVTIPALSERLALITAFPEVPLFNLEHELSLAFQPKTLLPETPDRDPEVALILFTSGTSSEPKGVMLTHRNLLFAAQAPLSHVKIVQNEQFLLFLPLSHIFGLTSLIRAMMSGVTTTLEENVSSQQLMEIIQRCHPTITIVTPRIVEVFYTQIAKKIQAKGKFATFLFDRSVWLCRQCKRFGINLGPYIFANLHAQFGGKLTRILLGGASLSRSILERCNLLGFKIIEGYGLTETSSLVTLNHVDDIHIGSVGKPPDGVEVKIANSNLQGEGEICVQSPTVMKGYFRNPQMTGDAIRDGWFHTGDLGYIDEKGDLVISGRVKEMIVLPSGKKAMPQDVESHYKNIPYVQELVVLGMRDDDQIGEKIHAAIVLEKQSNQGQTNTKENLTLEKMKEHVQQAISKRFEGLPPHLRIQRLHFVEAIPKTAVLKPKRHELRALLQKRESLQKPPAENAASEDQLHLDSLTKDVCRLLSEIARPEKKNQKIQLRSSLQFDWELDSMARLELIASIERKFGISMDPNQFMQVDRVEDLVNLVQANLKNPLESISKEKIHSPPLPHVYLSEKISLSQRIFFKFFRAFSRACWGLKAEGMQHLPKDQPFILAANHAAHFDVYWVAACLPEECLGRFFCFAKKEHFEKRHTAFMVRLVHAIPIKREGEFSSSLQQGLALLKGGGIAFIHPEGTRTRNGQLGLFRKGPAYLSMQAKVPLVPVYIQGAYDIYPHTCLLPRLFNWRFLRPFRLHISFGAPIFPPDLQAGLDVEERLINQVREAIVNMQKKDCKE